MSGDDDRQALRDVETGLVRLRRSMGRRTLGKALVQEMAARDQPADLSLFAVLDAVEAGPEPTRSVVTVNDVAARTDLDPSRASRVAAAAVSSGHLRRTASQSDARQVGLELTDAGQAVLDLAHARRQSAFAAAMADWTSDERAEFGRLLLRFTDPLGSSAPPPPSS